MSTHTHMHNLRTLKIPSVSMYLYVYVCMCVYVSLINISVVSLLCGGKKVVEIFQPMKKSHRSVRQLYQHQRNFLSQNP